MAKKIPMLKRHKHSGLWFIRLNGKPKYLGNKLTTEAEAEIMRQQILKDMEIQEKSPEQNRNETTVKALLTFYKNNATMKGGKKNTVDRIRYCDLFVEKFGNLTPQALKPYMIEKFLSEQEDWNQTTRCNFVKHISAASNWLVKNDKLPRNLVYGVERPQALVRGEEYLIANSEYLSLLPTIKNEYRDIVELLYLTGARPNEILSSRKEEYNADHKVLSKKEHKTKSKGKKRDIPLNTRANQIVQERVGRVQNGLLFKSVNGFQITPDILMQYMSRRFQEVGITHPVCDYSFRHTAAVRWLEAGIPLHTVASWLGNTVQICEKHYAHTLERVRNTVHLIPD